MTIPLIHKTKENNKVRDIDFTELSRFSERQQYHNMLRDYQRKNKAEIYKEWGNGAMNIMLQMPTGTGKTHLFASIIKDLQDYFYQKGSQNSTKSWGERNKWALPKILVLVHRIELIEQIHDTLAEKYKHSSGIVSGGVIIGETKNVIVASVQTFSRRAKLEKWVKDVDFDFIIIDEAHHSTADSYQRVRNTWPNARLLGVTATPYRLNHQPFTDVYDKLILSEPVYKFIEKGYLCQYDYFSIKPSSQIQYQIDHLATDFSGDYDERAMADLLNQDRIRASILGTYEKFAKGKKGIVYTINRLHNQMLASLFRAHGYNVAYIDSLTPKEERNSTVQAFRDGKLDIIFNVNIFSEGFDCPDVEFIQLARPTKSLSMYLQQVGRGFRISEGKEKVLFLDNVGLYNRFGLPSARRAWQHYFEGREDWQDEKGYDNGKLGEPRDTGVDLSEGNEEVNMIFSSLNQYPSEDVLADSNIEDSETNAPELTDDIQDILIDANTVIVCKGHQYILEKMSQREMAEMLLSIEDVRHTGMIDCDALYAIIEDYNKKRQMEIESFLVNSGYTKEELLAVLSGQQSTLNDKKVEGVQPGGNSVTENNVVQECLIVHTNNGKTIQETTGSKTLIKALQLIGLKIVYETCWTKFWKQEQTMQSLISTKNNINTKNKNIHGIEENGIVYYINTKTNTSTKRLQLENLNTVLNLGWTIEIIGGAQ